MIFFLYVPTESGHPEMAALAATDEAGAVREAQGLQYGGRAGYLFDGDRFVREVTTRAGILEEAPLLAVPPGGVRRPRAGLPLRPG